MNVIIWVAIGLFSGWIIATFVKHSTKNLIDIILGLIGGLSGIFIADKFLGISPSSAYAFFVAACGAVIFIFLGRLRSISK